MILRVAADLQRWLMLTYRMLAETIEPRATKRAVRSCRQLTVGGTVKVHQVSKNLWSCEVRHIFSFKATSISSKTVTLHSGQWYLSLLVTRSFYFSITGEFWSQTFLGLVVPPLRVTQKKVTTWRRCETDGSWRWWFASCTLYLGVATSLCNAKNC